MNGMSHINNEKTYNKQKNRVTMKKPISFKNGYGLTLRGFAYIPRYERKKTNKEHSQQKNDTAILFLHGFPGNCEGGTAKRIGKSFSQLGYLTMVFDFNGTRSSDGKFEDKLMSKEMKDIKYAIDFLYKNYKFKKLVVIGHSTGAIDAALYAYHDKRINKLILMGAESNLKHSVMYDFTDQQVHDFWTKGYIVYTHGKKWLRNKKLKKAFYDEFFTLDIKKSIKKYKRPLLIIHGEKDEAIPLTDPKELYHFAHKSKKLVIVKDADHRFTKKKYWDVLVREIEKFIV